MLSFFASKIRSIQIIAVLFLLIACGGRIKDAQVRKFPLQQYGLTSDKPHLIVFGALWCKPCRHEIDDLNELRNLFGDKILLTQYLVEGNIKGSNPTSEDTTNFISPLGSSPNYSLKLDPNWNLFDSLLPPSGRQLPMLVTVNSIGVITNMTQRSLHFQRELTPLLTQLIQGESEKPALPPNVRIPRIQIKGQYLAESGVPLEMINKLNEGWLETILLYGFTPDSMPFDAGLFELNKITLKPLSAEWNSTSNCQLSIFYNSDGSVNSHTGFCG